MNMQTFETNSIKELENIAKLILLSIQDKKVLLFYGDLAVGKTALIKQLIKSLGINEEAVSPTFTVMNEYGDAIKAYHYDIYQNGSDGFIASNLWQNLLHEGYHFIEWADARVENLLESIGIKFVRIVMEKQNETRIIKIT